VTRSRSNGGRGRKGPRGSLADSLFLLPGGLVMTLLFAIPLGMVVVFSFGTTDIVGLPQVGFTWTNYDQVLQSYYVPILLRTIGYAFAATVLCLLLGYPLAYFAVRFAGRWGQALIASIVLMWLVDYLVRIYAWTALLSDNGLINNVLSSAGLGRVHMLGTAGAVIVGLAYGYFPLMVLPIYAALGELDVSVIEAGKDLYGSPRQTFWRVTWPATIRGVIGGVLLVFLPALGDFATAQFLGGPQSSMIGNLINQQFNDAGSITFGAALTVVLLLLLLAGVAVALKFARGSIGAGGRARAA
jgi:spermidine/putrescine transport system permease protein